MSLEHWDRDVRPYLGDIEIGARKIRTGVANLQIRPEWPTMSEHELCEARRALQEAIDAVDEAKAAYASKPVEAA